MKIVLAISLEIFQNSEIYTHFYFRVEESAEKYYNFFKIMDQVKLEKQFKERQAGAELRATLRYAILIEIGLQLIWSK